MGNGYVGQIIRINLTNKNISYIQTSDYEHWGGGHGIGSAIFFDIAVREKGLDLAAMDHNSIDDGGFHPDNVLTIMTSPFNGTIVPGASGRTEIQGIGTQAYPIGWFTRSNFGGRFGTMVKFAGYDGIVIEGASATPVWIDIRDDSIQIHDCADLDLWGQSTQATQQRIWDYVAGDDEYGQWISPDNANGQTTQRPAVLAIGPAGESRSRLACLIHDAGNASGQGGFGGVWGSKNLKAISVIGTGGIEVADAKALMEARMHQMDNYGFDVKNPRISFANYTRFSPPPKPQETYKMESGGLAGLIPRSEDKRPQGCVGCPAACRARYKSGRANETGCFATKFYEGANTSTIQYEAIDLMNGYGFNAYEMVRGLKYLKDLSDMGVIGGPGSEIESDLSFSDYGSIEFVERFFETIVKRDTVFGDTVAEGFRRAIEIWSRTSDIGNRGEGKIELPYWGFNEHDLDGRSELEWGYGSILGDRDINEHCLNSMFQDGLLAVYNIGLEEAKAYESVSIHASKMVPYRDDYATLEDSKQMLNYGDSNMYSEHIVRLVAWHRHYTRFYKQSLLFCDTRWPDIINIHQADKVGSTGEAEPKFFKAVTGNDLSFVEGMELGRKIWNLDNAIWALQGRHRNMVHFADYIYTQDATGYAPFGSYPLPTYNPSLASPEKQWAYRDVGNRHIEKGVYPNEDNIGDDFEGFKTRFYMFEGWDTSSGWPTRVTLEDMDLGYVADLLMNRGKLGS